MLSGLSLFYSYLIATSVDFKDCGSASGHLDSITVTGCDQGDKCVFKVGTNVTFNAKFTSNVDSSKAIVKIVGLIDNVIPVPFPISPDDACGNYGVKCPFTKGSQNQVAITLPIKSEYPAMSLSVKFRLVDSNSANLFCVQFPVKIEH